MQASERDRELDDLRGEMIAQLRHFFRWRFPVLPGDRAVYRVGLHIRIRRIRALDAVRADASEVDALRQHCADLVGIIDNSIPVEPA